MYNQPPVINPALNGTSISLPSVRTRVRLRIRVVFYIRMCNSPFVHSIVAPPAFAAYANPLPAVGVPQALPKADDSFIPVGASVPLTPAVPVRIPRLHLLRAVSLKAFYVLVS